MKPHCYKPPKSNGGGDSEATQKIDGGVHGKFVDLACQVVEANPVPWEEMESCIDRNAISQLCEQTSAVAIEDALMRYYATKLHKKVVVCKSMTYCTYHKEFSSFYSSATRKGVKYIYLYRDPRDVALSFTKAVVGDKHVYSISKTWAKLQETCLEIQAKDPDSILLISYEEITGEPEDSLARICTFLHVQYDPTVLKSFNKSPEAKNRSEASSLWTNVSKDIDKNNSNKFVKELTPEQIRIIEVNCGHIMDHLGYERLHTEPGTCNNFTEEEIKEFNKQNERLMQERNATLKAEEPEDFIRRERLAAAFKELNDFTKANMIPFVLANSNIGGA